MYEEEPNSEPELEEEDCLSEETEDDSETKKSKKSQQKRKNNIFDYKNTLRETLNPYNDARRSTAIDRTASNYNDAKEKVQKIRDLIDIGKYDADLAKYIPGMLDLAFQGIFDDIDKKNLPTLLPKIWKGLTFR